MLRNEDFLLPRRSMGLLGRNCQQGEQLEIILMKFPIEVISYKLTVDKEKDGLPT